MRSLRTSRVPVARASTRRATSPVGPAGPATSTVSGAGRRQRALEGALVLVDDRAALEPHAAGGQRRRHRGRVVVDGASGEPMHHQPHAGGSQPSQPAAPRAASASA